MRTRAAFPTGAVIAAAKRWARTLAHRFRLAVLAAALLAAGVAEPAAALDPALRLSQFTQTHWTVEEGAPPAIYDIAEDQNGFIWIGSVAGIDRFDGVSFEHVAAPQAEAAGRVVTEILVAQDGAVWIGYESGNFAIYRDGVLQEDAVPALEGFIALLVQTTDGAVWANVGNGPLMRYVAGRWEEIGSEWGLSAASRSNLLAAANGSLWLTNIEGVFELSPGARRFVRVSDTTPNAALSEDHEGAIWLSDHRGTRMIRPGRHGRLMSAIFPTPRSQRTASAFFDRDGNLWGEVGQSAFRVVSPAAFTADSAAGAARVEIFRANDGRNAGNAGPMLEDREGNIWIGTVRGLTRIRAVRVVVEPDIVDPPAFGFVLFGARNGDVYVGARDAIYRIAPRGRPERLIEGVPQADAICEGQDGAVWAVLRGALLQIRGSRVTRHVGPVSSRNGIAQCVVDHNNVLWAAGQRAGLFRYERGTWTVRPPQDLNHIVFGLAPDPQRRMIQFLGSGDIVRANDGGEAAEVLYHGDVDTMTTLMHEGGALLIGATDQLIRVREGETAALSTQRFPWLSAPSGMVQTPDGHTWMLTSAGAVGIETEALNRAFEDPDYNLASTVLTFADGLPSVQVRGGANSVARGGDGRIWFAPAGAVAWVDPARMSRNELPPTVVIRAFEADGTAYRDPRRAIALRPGAGSVAINYTALSLSMPERVRFRYRLRGDAPWVDAGNRREAFFTNLGPGTYRFEVIAANDDGVWNEEGAHLEFTIPPTFLQSVWFKFLLAAVLAGLLWFAYAWRLRQETARLHSRFEIRIAERERIARELHDTLLQGFQGLLLRFQSLANGIPNGSDLRRSLDEAIDRAEAVLVDGRERVRDLRHSTASADLVSALTDLASSVIEGDTPRFSVLREGTPRVLNPIASEEMLRIAEEALRNAVRHARATTIEALLTYRRGGVQLVLRDNGSGIDADVLARGGRSGHFGLVGMRERAERIGGRLTVTSKTGAGAEISLFVPAKAAYQNQAPRLRERLLRRLRGGRA